MERGDREMIDRCDHNGRLPIHYAAYYGDYKETKLLLECGSLVDPVDSCGQTPRLLAISRGYTYIASLLDFHEKFLYTVTVGNLRDCSYAINAIPPPSLYARRRDGYTALGLARKEGHSLIAKILWDLMCTGSMKYERTILDYYTKYPPIGNSVYLW